MCPNKQPTDRARDLPFRPPRIDKRLQQMRQPSRTDTVPRNPPATGRTPSTDTPKQKPGQAQREAKPHSAAQNAQAKPASDVQGKAAAKVAEVEQVEIQCDLVYGSSDEEFSEITAHMHCDSASSTQTKKMTEPSSVSGVDEEPISKQPRMFMVIRIVNIKLKALVDTGAHCNFLRHDVFKKISPAPAVAATNWVFKTASGTPVETIGISQLAIICKVKGVKVSRNTYFVISTNLRGKCILGMTFLRRKRSIPRPRKIHSYLAWHGGNFAVERKAFRFRTERQGAFE